MLLTAQTWKGIDNTADDIVFQTERWDANLSYSIPVPYSGDYQVILYFAEIHTGSFSNGARVFDVSLEGNLGLDDYDVYAAVGERFATSESFAVNVTDGTLNIDFTSSAGNAKLSGIGILYTGVSLTVTPDNYSFNALVVGQSDTADFLLGNASNVSITVDSIQLTGANPGDFTTNLTTGTIMADSTLGFKVFYSPLVQTPAVKTADLMIYHSGDNTPLTVSLTGSVACPAAGTPCNDGNLATVNDVEDGNCNCAGVGPVVTIDSPANGDVLPYGDFNIDFSLQNWPLDGNNHLDLWIDDVKTNAYYDSLPILISGLSAGTHELRLELEYVDHSEVGSQDSITVTICDPSGLSCDDGDANTVNDTTDGNCGCAGTSLAPAYSMYINSGGSAYTALDGRQFIADSYYNNGATYAQTWKGIDNTADDIVFQTERWDANLSYSIPVPSNGNYDVTLYFAEIHTGSFSNGARVMDVNLEGSMVMDDYDIYATVGSRYADSHTFSVSVTDGTLNIDFTSSAGNAKLSGIGIVQYGADLTVSPGNMVFATTEIDSTKSASFVLDNANSMVINIDSVVFSGTESGDFSTNLTTGWFVGASSDTSFNVDFTPQNNTPQLRNAVMSIYHTGTNSPLTVTLSGETTCPLVGQSCDDGDLNTDNDVYDINCNCVGTFTPLTQSVANNAGTTNLTVTTSIGVSTYKFYADGVLEASYNSNSVSHTWTGSTNRYVEFYPPANDFSTVIGTLDFDNQKLTGNLSVDYTKLVNVSTLYLAKNPIVGSLPSTIGNMQSLQYLRLENCDLSGAIPNEIGNLSNLKNFYGHNNNFSGTVPASIGQLSNLEQFILQNNNITGQLPNEIGQLAKLKSLSFLNNNLNGAIPASFSNLINIDVIVLQGNQLSGYIPGTFAGYVNMRYLIASNNQFTQMDIDSMLVDLQASQIASGRTNTYIDFRSNTAPSTFGKSIADSLIALGWTVLHDPLPAADIAKGAGSQINEGGLSGTEGGTSTEASLGSEEFNTQVSVAIYPNPAQVGGSISIEVSGLPQGNTQVELISIQGQIIDRVNMETQFGQNVYGYQIPDGLAEGQYIIRISQDNWLENRIIKLK